MAVKKNKKPPVGSFVENGSHGKNMMMIYNFKPDVCLDPSTLTNF